MMPAMRPTIRGFPGADIPKLLCRDGVDAAKVVLFGPRVARVELTERRLKAGLRCVSTWPTNTCCSTRAAA